MRIESQKIDVNPRIKIADDIDIVASDSVFIGEYAYILPGFKVRCRSLYIGRHCYIGAGVEIGGGGCNGPNAHVSIGERSLIAERSFINCAESVTIGEHVAFGYETQVWTHGVWQPVANGFGKMKQEPVKIGNEVWLPSRCQVMAGVEIGDNVVVGMGSLVNKSLPAGCVAVGRPAKIIKENEFPKAITDEDLRAELNNILKIYMAIAEDKGFEPTIIISGDCIIKFAYLAEHIDFNIRTKELMKYNPETRESQPTTYLTVYAEDFRDFLRRWGFAFYGGGFFESIEPKRFQEAQ